MVEAEVVVLEVLEAVFPVSLAHGLRLHGLAEVEVVLDQAAVDRREVWVVALEDIQAEQAGRELTLLEEGAVDRHYGVSAEQAEMAPIRLLTAQAQPVPHMVVEVEVQAAGRAPAALAVVAMEPMATFW